MLKQHKITSCLAPKWPFGLALKILIVSFLFIRVNAGANPTNATVEKEIAEVFKKNPDKEIVVKVEKRQAVEKVAKFEPTKEPNKDPYNQIQTFVETQDMEYFLQLKKSIEAKDSTEQMKYKAVVYAILQDTTLTQKEKETMSLAMFEKFSKLPGSNYRFVKKNSAIVINNPKYEEKYQRYSAYKYYLDGLALDNKIKQLDKEIERLKRENNLLQQLLDGYNKTQ